MRGDVILLVGLSLHNANVAQGRSDSSDNNHRVKNIVLLHGAWADDSSWSKIITILEAKGFHVVAAQLPLPVPVQFEETAYVPVGGSAAITP